jgi:hypothetical protein
MERPTVFDRPEEGRREGRREGGSKGEGEMGICMKEKQSLMVLGREGGREGERARKGGWEGKLQTNQPETYNDAEDALPSSPSSPPSLRSCPSSPSLRLAVEGGGREGGRARSTCTAALARIRSGRDFCRVLNEDGEHETLQREMLSRPLSLSRPPLSSLTHIQHSCVQEQSSRPPSLPPLPYIVLVGIKQMTRSVPSLTPAPAHGILKDGGGRSRKGGGRRRHVGHAHPSSTAAAACAASAAAAFVVIMGGGGVGRAHLLVLLQIFALGPALSVWDGECGGGECDESVARAKNMVACFKYEGFLAFLGLLSPTTNVTNKYMHSTRHAGFKRVYLWIPFLQRFGSSSQGAPCFSCCLGLSSQPFAGPSLLSKRVPLLPPPLPHSLPQACLRTTHSLGMPPSCLSTSCLLCGPALFGL